MICYDEHMIYIFLFLACKNLWDVARELALYVLPVLAFVRSVPWQCIRVQLFSEGYVAGAG